MDAIAWDTVERIAIRVAGREPLAESYHYASLEPDFREFTAEAEALVEAETGLKSLAGPARARVTDRAEVVKDPLPSKGARISTHVTLPGRYLVLLPTVSTSASRAGSRTTPSASACSGDPPSSR